MHHYKGKSKYLILISGCIFLGSWTPVYGVFEEIEGTPTNTNGFEIGELSMPQYVFMMLVFLKLSLLYGSGVLPLEINLGALWDKYYYGDYYHHDDEDDYGADHHEDDERYTSHSDEGEASSYSSYEQPRGLTGHDTPKVSAGSSYVSYGHPGERFRSKRSTSPDYISVYPENEIHAKRENVTANLKEDAMKYGKKNTNVSRNKDSRGDVDAYYKAYDTDRKHSKTAAHPLLWDCPLQFVCEMDQWARRPHSTFLEDMLARWLKDPSGKSFFANANAATFSGQPETCPEMYPCPFDVQKAVGVSIPGSTPYRAPGVYGDDVITDELSIDDVLDKKMALDGVEVSSWSRNSTGVPPLIDNNDL